MARTLGIVTSGGPGNPTCASRRALLLAALGTWLAGAAAARDGHRVAYIDIDTPGAREGFTRFTHALRKAAERNGASFEVRFVALDQTDPRALEALPGRVAELSPWLVVATSLPTARVARAMGHPALFYTPADPVVLGLVESNARPGGLMTGYAGHPPSIEKMLEVAAEAMPARRRVRILTDSLFAKFSSPAADLQAAGRRLGRDVSVEIVDTLEHLDVLAARGFDSAEALVVPYTAVPFRHTARLLEAIAAARIPAVHGSSRVVREGGLIGIEADISDVPEVFARQAWAMAAGVSPGDIPVERPRRFSLSANMGAARALRLTLPATFLKRVDQIVG